MFIFQQKYANEAVVPSKEKTVDYLNLNKINKLIMAAFYPSEQEGSMRVPKIVSDAISKVLKAGPVSEIEITSEKIANLKKEINLKLKGKDYETVAAIIGASIYSGYKKAGNVEDGF